MATSTEAPTGRRASDSVAVDTATLLAFFKALADANRLRIVGLLAEKARTVEQLAAVLHLSGGTVSHHLRRLADASLVTARPEGYYRLYSLRADVLHKTAEQLLGRAPLSRLADDADLDAYERKVLEAFTDEEGRFVAFPAQQKKYLVLVQHAARLFDAGRRYSEREVNATLSRLHEDTARLRRDLVGHGFMQREGGGGDYWLASERRRRSAGR
jgi:predicted transcriptional regulator